VGDGGHIHIVADHFIESATSLIDASSKFGRDGEVWINASEEDFSEATGLPKDFLPVEKLSSNRCAGFSIENINRFLVIARYTLPTAPSDLRTHLYVPQ
jgi:hypothetical protein